MTNYHSNLDRISPNRQTSQYILKPEQKVYLYGDTQLSGILIRPLERIYPLLVNRK